MSHENVEMVRKAYEENMDRRVALFAEHADSDLEWVPDGRVGEGPIRGRDEVLEFFVDRASVFGEMEVEVEQTWDLGQQVLVFIRVRGSGSASSAGFDIRIAHLWTLRDGMLVRGQGFGDRDEALESAGLSVITRLRRAYEAYSRGDFDSAIEIAHPDIELVTLLHSYRGVENLRAWMEPETMENLVVEADRFEVAGNSVLAHQHSRGRGVASGVEVEMDFWVVWTFDEQGLATRLVGFTSDDEAKARAAAGLPAAT